MSEELFNMWRKVFADIVREESPCADDILLAYPEVNDYYMSRHHMITEEEEDEMLEEFWADQEKAFKQLFKENIY